MKRSIQLRGLGVLASILAAGGAGVPGRAAGHPPYVRPTALTVDDKDKKDDDKKQEEPKGDPVDVDKLPKAVVDAVKKELPGSRITKAAKLDDGNYFLDDVKVGKDLWDVTVSPKGEIVKKVKMKE